MPARSLEQQRQAALEEANRRRSLRAQRKTLWKRGGYEEAVADLLDLMEDTPSWAAHWKVFDALVVLPKVGRVKATRVLRSVRMSPVKTLGGISDRQRRELAAALTAARCPECGAMKDTRASRCWKCRYPGPDPRQSR
jgi:hypothetical protein